MITKFLITLILITSTSLSFGQTFARAVYYEYGFVDTLTQEVDWNNKTKMEPALVTIGSRYVKIYTDKLQQYFFRGSKYDLAEFKGYYYNSYTAEGKECVVYFYREDDGFDYLEIEYNNFVIKYHLSNLE